VPDPVIRLLAPEDLGSAFSLSSTAGWNQRLDDWRMLLALAPAGSFAAVTEGRIAGTAIGIDYGGFAWIAMMLVDPAYRGRGLGRRLLEAAMGAVPADRPIRLDATPMGRSLYRAYGFEDEAALTRHIADRVVPSGRQSHSTPLSATDLPAIAEQDARIFGGDRRALLDWAHDRGPQYARLVRTKAGRASYCLGRQGRLFDQIGPVIADDDDAARALVTAALREAEGHAVVIDVFDSRDAFAAWLCACGFRGERRLFRMRRPPPDRARDARRGRRFPPGDTGTGVQIGENRSALAEFAILGPEFG
jgi:GNAT superfamily N-acetyltransferase